MQWFTVDILWIFLIASFLFSITSGNGRNSKSNPESCCTECECSSKEVNCQNKNLSSFPRSILPTTEKLNLSHNRIGAIDDIHFHLQSVVDSDLVKNSIKTFKMSQTSNGFEDLQSLDLSHNNLTEVPKPLLKFLKRLKTLNLSRNPIVKFRAKAFEPLGSTLTHLILNELNHLTFISQFAFSGLRKVKVLKISSCRLTEVPSVLHLRNLIELVLSSNSIRMINSNAFIGANQLTHLYLSSNQIDRIDSDAFSDLPLLEFLDLSDNKLTSVNANIFRKNTQLRFLLLESNPWYCDCKLSFLIRFLSENNLCSSESCPLCSDPDVYRNKSLAMITNMDPPLLCSAFLFNPPLRSSVKTKRNANGRNSPCKVAKQPMQRTSSSGSSSRKILQHGRYKATITRLNENDNITSTSTELRDEGYEDCNDSDEKSIKKNTQKPVSEAAVTSEQEKRKSKKETETVTTSQKQNEKDFNQNVNTTAVAGGCFASLTIFAACFIIVYYKLYKSPSSSSRHGEDDLESSNQTHQSQKSSKNDVISSSLSADTDKSRRKLELSRTSGNYTASGDPSIHRWIGSISRELEKYSLPPPLLPIQKKDREKDEHFLPKHDQAKQRHRQRFRSRTNANELIPKSSDSSTEFIQNPASVNLHDITCREQFQSSLKGLQATKSRLNQLHQNGLDETEHNFCSDGFSTVPVSFSATSFSSSPGSCDQDSKRQNRFFRKTDAAVAHSKKLFTNSLISNNSVRDSDNSFRRHETKV